MVEIAIRQISIEPFNISKACPNALNGAPLVRGGALMINLPRVLPLAPVSLVGHAHTLVASVAVEPDWAQCISDQMKKMVVLLPQVFCLNCHRWGPAMH